MKDIEEKTKNTSLTDNQEYTDFLKTRLKEYSFATFERSFNNEKDGLRPVTRRAIYTMHELKLTTAFKKVQYVAGAEMKYHPYNSDTIADSITHLGQWFTTSYPYLDTQGNFGSLNDIQSFAAPRYIECKLSQFARDCITDSIDDHCISYVPNYDNTFIEPEYLPTKIPLSLIQSSWGIGEAFMNSIPAYNLNDVADCCIKVIRNKNIGLKELMKGIYPDFPTGGIITNKSEIDEFHSLPASKVEALSREGKNFNIKYRAKCEIDRDKNIIRILELPADVDFMMVWSKILEEVQERNNIILSGIVNKSDHLDPKHPGNIIFELICKKDANMLEILDQLYLKTPLATSASLSFILYCGEYLKRMSFKDIIMSWYQTQCDIKRRKFNFLLSDASNKIHVLEGIITVYDKMDDVIKTIRASKDKEDAIANLEKRFKLTTVQAGGIVSRSLASLTRVSKGQLFEEIAALKKNIELYEDRLIHIDDVIIEDLIFMKKKYGRPRRTEVIDLKGDRSEKTAINISNGAIMYSRDSVGIFDSTALSNGKTILNSMKPVKVNGKNTKEIIGYHPVTKNISGLIVFNKDGTAKRLKISDVPITNNWIIVNDANYPISCVVPVYENEEESNVIVLNDEFKIKKFSVSEIGKKVNTGVVIAAKLLDKEEENNNVLVYNDNNEYLYFAGEEVPVLSRNSAGVLTTFSNKDARYNIITMDESKDSNLLITFLGDEMNNYFSGLDEISLDFGKRTNKPKSFYKLKAMKFSGCGLINSKEKNDSNLVLISPYSTIVLKGKYLKDAMDPKKISIKPFGVIQIKGGN